MVRRDLVPDLDRAHAGVRLGHRNALRHGGDVRAADDLRLLHALPRGRTVEEHLVVDRELLRRGNGRDRVLARILDLARQRGRRRRLRRNQVDLRALRAAAALEVAVVRAQRDRARAGRHVRADAEAAGVLENAAARLDEDRERAVRREHVHDLARTAGDADLDVLRHVLALEIEGDRADVAVGAVRAGADHDLVDLRALHGPDGHDVARRMRRGHEGLELVERDLEDVVVGGALVRDELRPVLRAALRREELLRDGVGREDGRRDAQLRAHVGDRRAARHVERLHAGAEVLEDPADVALRAILFKHLEDDVLRAAALRQLARELDAAHLRRGDVERAAGHRDRDVDAARADGDLADAAARRRVRVGAEERRPRLAEALEVQLVADAVAALGVDDAELLGDGREEVVVVGVLEADLHRVVVHVGDGELVADMRHVHRFELKIGHRARRVLRQRLVDADAELGVLRGIALHQMGGDDLLHDVLRRLLHGLLHVSSLPRLKGHNR